MKLVDTIQRTALAALAAGGILTLAAPLLPVASEAQAGSPAEETTVTISTSRDAQPTVVKLPTLAVGETRTITSEGGKPVVVTRTEAGYTVKVGEREIKVVTHGDVEAPNVIVNEGDGAKKVIVKKHAYAFQTGDTPKANAADVLKKAELKSVEALDVRTRGTVESVLQELLDKGAVVALPGAMTWVEGTSGDQENVKVIVIKKDEKAK